MKTIIVDDDVSRTKGFLQDVDAWDVHCALRAHYAFVHAARDSSATTTQYVAHTEDELNEAMESGATSRDEESEEEKDKTRRRLRRRARKENNNSVSLCEPYALRQSVQQKFMLVLQRMYDTQDVEDAAGSAVFSCFSKDVFRSINYVSSYVGPVDNSSSRAVTRNPCTSSALNADLCMSFSGVDRVRAGAQRLFSLSPDGVAFFHSSTVKRMSDGKTVLRYHFSLFFAVTMLLPHETEREKDTDKHAAAVAPQRVHFELRGHSVALFDENNMIVSSVDHDVHVARVSSPAVSAMHVMRGLGYC